MLNKEREQEIINILKTTNGFVTVKKLCDTLYASESSIRRDLKVLEKRGLIKRTYGGATVISNYSGIGTFNSRTTQNAEAKREIAKKAAALVGDGAIVFLDQSSTSFYLANELMNRTSLTIATNNIEIMMLLSGTSIRIISSGGFLSDENRNCLIGGDAQATFNNIYADLAFFSVKAVSSGGEVTDCSREEIIVRSAMLKNAAKTALLCDSAKFDSHAPYRQCHITDVDYLICEGEKANKFSKYKDKIKLL